MVPWLNELCGLFFNIFGRETLWELYVLVALCILLGALALSRISTKLGALGAFYTTGVVVTVFGLVLLLAVMAILPAFTYFPFWVSLIMTALVLLGVVIPLTVLVQHGKYTIALIAWTAVLLTIGTVLVLEPIAKRSLEKLFGLAIESVKEVKQHRIDTEEAK